MSVSVPAILKYLHSSNGFNAMENAENNEGSSRAKKRRLDHLTWEEKIQRKKLKNRVAAQTSRDRKKAKMEQMEAALRDLYARNEELSAECERLRAEAAAASRTSSSTASCAACGAARSRPVECVGQSGPAATRDPRPKGLARHSAATSAALAIATACLLFRTCSTSWARPTTTTSTSTRSRRSPGAFSRTSPPPRARGARRRKRTVKNQWTLRRQDGWWGKHQKSWNPIEANA